MLRYISVNSDRVRVPHLAGSGYQGRPRVIVLPWLPNWVLLTRGPRDICLRMIYFSKCDT